MWVKEEELTPKLQEVQKQIYVDFQDLCKRHSIPFFVSGGTAIGTIRHKGFIPWDDDIDVCMLRKDYDKAIYFIRKELSDKYTVFDCDSHEGYVMAFARLCRNGTKMQEHADTDTNYTTGIFIDMFAYDKTTPNARLVKKQIRRTWLLARLIVLSKYKRPKFPKDLKGIKLKVAKILCTLIHYILNLFHLKKRVLYKMYIKEATKYNNSKYQLYTDFSYSQPEKVLCTYDMIFPLKEMPFEDITVQMLNNADKYLTSQYGNYMEIPPVDKRITHNPGYVDFGDGNVYRKDK